MKGIFILSFLFVLTNTALWGQTKRALIVAIGDYPNNEGRNKHSVVRSADSSWSDLNAANDLLLIKEVLSKQKFMDTTILRDQEATKGAILTALNSLIDRCRTGDQVFIHFSSHGQQITDVSGDEADGYDEAIVCYEAPKLSGVPANYKGEGHLLDDEVEAIVRQIRQKLGRKGSILLLVDACHSATITRGATARSRGASEPYILKGRASIPRSSVAQTSLMIFSPSVVRSEQKGLDLAPYVVYSAAQAHQPNNESQLPNGELVGSLSYAFSRAMGKIREGESYRALFSRIAALMNVSVPGQTPEAEGDLDRDIFNGQAISQQAYVAVKSIRPNQQQLTIDAGQLTGVFTGSKVSLCLDKVQSLKDCKSPISGTVVLAGFYNSEVKIEKRLPSRNPNDSWVFVTERSYGNLSIPISFSIADRTMLQKVRQVLASKPLIQFNEPPELVVFQDPSNHESIGIRRANDGGLLDKLVLVNSTTNWNTLVEQIQHYAQSKFLKSFSHTNSDIDVAVELFPVKKEVKVPTYADTLRRSDFNREGWPVFSEKDGDRAVMQLKNQSKLPIFYNVIDIQPDGVVNVIFPDSGANPREYIVKPGETRLAPGTMTFGEPYGTEIFKVFITTEPIDLRQVVGKPAASGQARSLMHVLEQLYDKTNEMVTRGDNPNPIPDSEMIVTIDYPFQIIEKRQK